MGVDLTIAVSDTSEPGDPDGKGRAWIANAWFEMSRDHDLWAAIGNLPVHAMERPVIWPFMHTDVQTTETDGLDGPLGWVAAGDLARAIETSKQPYVWNLAITAFLRALPANAGVVLYWN